MSLKSILYCPPVSLGTVSAPEPSGYLFTVKDRRLFSTFQGSGQGTAQSGNTSPVNSSKAVSETVIGNTLSYTAISTDSLFGTNSSIVTIITIEGRDSGARAQIAVTINKEASGITDTATGNTANQPQ